MPYEFDAALLKDRQVNDVLMRRIYRFQEQLPAIVRNMSSGHPVTYARIELRNLRERIIELEVALDEYFDLPACALYEAVGQWKNDCFEATNTMRTETIALYRSFQSWANTHDAPACSLEKFQDLLWEEAKIRVRFDNGRGYVDGKLKEMPLEAEVLEVAPETPPFVDRRRFNRPLKRTVTETAAPPAVEPDAIASATAKRGRGRPKRLSRGRARLPVLRRAVRSAKTETDTEA
jgi:hypothetical protein